MLFCLLLRETWICFNHDIVWQLLHKAQPCFLIFRPPSHFVHFQNWPPKIKPLRKLCPPPNHPPFPPPPLLRRNKRSVPKGRTIGNNRRWGSLRSADVFPVVAFLGGREATTGNTSSLRRLEVGWQFPKRIFYGSLIRPVPTCWADVIKHCTFHYNSTVNLPGVIVLFKIRDASGERKYLITASNLTELTLTLNKSSKNVLLKCSFIRFIYCYSIVCLDFSPGVGLFWHFWS